MLESTSERTAPPLKRPADLASRTTPVARAPLGTAIFPAISIGVETVAEKFCPDSEVFELSDSSRTTVMVVFAGTTNGLDERLSRMEDLPEDDEPFLVPPGAPFGDEFEAESGAGD